MGCYISRLENLSMVYDTYFFLVGDYSNRSFVNDIFRNDFRSIARRIGGGAVIVDQNDCLEYELMHALTSYPDYDIGASLAAFGENLPGLLVIDRHSMEQLMQCRSYRSRSFRPRQCDSSGLNLLFIPFELMEQAYSSPNLLIRDLADLAFRKNTNLLNRTIYADVASTARERSGSFNSRWGGKYHRAAMDASISPDPYDELTVCHHIETALSNIMRNPLYRGLRENYINDALRDNLGMIYDVHDQTRQGLSENGKDAGALDLLIMDPYRFPYALIEALRLSYLDTGSLSRHFSKALVNYDPQGLAMDFLVCYVTSADFNAFCSKLAAWLNDLEFPYECLSAVKELPGRFAELRHFQITLRRQGMPFTLHTYAVHLPS